MSVIQINNLSELRDASDLEVEVRGGVIPLAAAIVTQARLIVASYRFVSAISSGSDGSAPSGNISDIQGA
jgi:hypothetical protein